MLCRENPDPETLDILGKKEPTKSENLKPEGWVVGNKEAKIPSAGRGELFASDLPLVSLL